MFYRLGSFGQINKILWNLVKPMWKCKQMTFVMFSLKVGNNSIISLTEESQAPCRFSSETLSRLRRKISGMFFLDTMWKLWWYWAREFSVFITGVFQFIGRNALFSPLYYLSWVTDVTKSFIMGICFSDDIF